MKRRLLFALALAALSAMPCARAHAAGINLSWNDCGTAGVEDQSFACNTNTGAAFVLVLSVVPPAGTTAITGAEISLEFNAASPTLPDWWRLEPGGCNAGAMTGTGDYTGLGACTDPWNGGGTALVQVWSPGEPRGGANQARMIVTSSVVPANFASLQAGVEYYAAHLRLSLARGSGVGSCAGCLRGACLVLNSVQLGRLPGASPTLVTVVPTSGGTPGIATWQNGHAECAAVPVRNRTWGAIKSLYR